ncbi:2-amino-4-hydroxy-6-hydroxymethyldihydropteridine diphosphokinase [Trichococcus pasteurii]|uniref:2-amino-4-hydroxy-6-hydroxymethyldihydropteridine diphosphokinase n=1 Tax=Trichococcus pasteurii TaxID=43064 RepID=A0A1W1III5_9LACT|nr:2-amino-4-hydroxy-6-hydroxymethyldihydropteridine diphosphokinase [Trichococcus pasteurii]SFE72945.1 2-amino-4-hydroxy-6-hydroxymethyldihydropteridinediphosphokinase [Trichococcus pasteurii]SLM52669.1 7 8-dihydro-6-hydroxymethylpterin-pyrophosphokinase hppk [Trichococcus pasteurii]SSB93550.1 7 8-dihydro-6-hydroxymethylpterin-pyrophosphokinase hppk [Trichococcus pasteurii]
MPIVYIALGTNLEPRATHLEKALELFRSLPDVEVKRVSSIYESKPVGYLDQPDFLNLVFEADTDLLPMDLLDSCQNIEQELGRVRTIRFGPRTLDVDIVLYGVESIEEERLTVPHPRMQERSFVLLPLQELNPEFVVPGWNKTVNELVAELPPEDLEEIWKYAPEA